jgi:hypothetical protein
MPTTEYLGRVQTSRYSRPTYRIDFLRMRQEAVPSEGTGHESEDLNHDSIVLQAPTEIMSNRLIHSSAV